MNTIRGISFLALTVAAINANLITNGSFETPGHSEAAWLEVAPASSFITGWVTTHNGVDYHNEAHFGPAYDGDFMVDLSAGAAQGGISQNISTVPGESYILSFAMAGPEESLENPRTLLVTIDGIGETFSQAASAPHSLAWGIKTLEFTATGPTTTLAFIGNVNGDYWGPVIDEVSVVAATAVPEGGSSLLILGMAIGLAGSLAKRRAKPRL